MRAVGELMPSGVDRQLSLTFSGYENHPHAQALLSTTMAARTPTTMAICGDRGRIELDGDFYTPGRVRLVSPAGEAITSPPDVMVGHQGLAHETAHFAQLVAEGLSESSLLPLDESVAIMEPSTRFAPRSASGIPGE